MKRREERRRGAIGDEKEKARDSAKDDVEHAYHKMPVCAREKGTRLVCELRVKEGEGEGKLLRVVANEKEGCVLVSEPVL